MRDAHRHVTDEAVNPQVARAVVNGTSPADWATVAALARDDVRVTPAFGLHPWRVAESPAGWQAELHALLRSFPQAAIGEIGLDASARHAPHLGAQLAVFGEQLALARALDRVVVVHCVRAWVELERALGDAGGVRVLLHGFAGPVDRIPALAALDVTFSFAPGFERRPQTLVAARGVPPERLLLESDAPRPGPTLADAYDAMAAARGVALTELVARCAERYEALFGPASSASSIA